MPGARSGPRIAPSAPITEGGIVTVIFNAALSNCTISANTGDGIQWGTAAAPGYAVNLASCTICSNSGVGIRNDSWTWGTVTVHNTLVGGNSGGVGPDCSGGLNSADFNLIQNTNNLTITGVTTHNIYNQNPQLGPLQDNGGPTPTHALLPGSPAIDAGDPSFISPPSFDQRGTDFPRVVNGRIDIGAFEGQTRSWTSPTDGKWETAANWSFGIAPCASDLADFLTNANSKTVMIDAVTTNSPGTMTINNLTIASPLGFTNALFVNNAGLAAPLSILNALAINTNSTLAVNNSAVDISGDLIVGFIGNNATLIISNSGALYDNVGYLGGSTNTGSSGANNSALVTGNGSVWVNQSTLYVGYDGDSNSLTIANGGAVYSASGVVGLGNKAVGIVFNPDSSGGMSANNSVFVTGSGSVWSNSGPLYVGDHDGFAGNWLTISNGAHVYSDSGYVGDNGAGSVVVTGTGSLWSMSGQLKVTKDGAGILTISGGGAVCSAGGVIGEMNPGSVVVTGSGSVWSNSADLIMGHISYPAAHLTITNGGAVVDNNVYLGGSGNPNCTATVSGNAATWQNCGNLYLGYYSRDNQLSIGQGGSVIASNLVFGPQTSSGTNLTIVSGGALYVTNALGGGQLNVVGGALLLNSGTTIVNQLLLTNGVSSLLTFNGGLLASGGSFVTNSQTFVVGDGADAATFQLNGASTPSPIAWRFAATLCFPAVAQLMAAFSSTRVAGLSATAAARSPSWAMSPTTARCKR